MSKKQIKNIGGYIQVDRETIKEIDYLEKLSKEEKEWLERFLDNEYNARFHNDGKDVVTDREEQKAKNRAKYKRRVDFTNSFFTTDSKIVGESILSPKPKPPKKEPKQPAPKRRKSRPVAADSKIETVEEFLARGGSITQVPESVSQDVIQKENKESENK